MLMCASVGGAVAKEVGTLEGVWAAPPAAKLLSGEDGVPAAGCSATCEQLQRQAHLLFHSSTSQWAAQSLATE